MFPTALQRRAASSWRQAARTCLVPDRVARAAVARTGPTPYEVAYLEHGTDLRRYEPRPDDSRRDLWIENELVENRLEVAGRRVDLDEVRMPVALVLGADQFVPREWSLPFLDAVASEDTRVFEFPTGHVGTFVDPAAHETGWPGVFEWLAERS